MVAHLARAQTDSAHPQGQALIESYDDNDKVALISLRC